MTQDSFTPQMKWQGEAYLSGSNEFFSTRSLSQLGMMPRQEICEDVEKSISSWGRTTRENCFSTESEERVRTVGPRLSKPSTRQDEVVLLKKWDGFVVKILDDGFVAQFESNEIGSDSLEAEFDIEELVDSDKEILTEGMPVIWCISRERSNGGQKRCSTIYLRRQAAPRATEVSAAVKTLNEWFTIPTSSTST